MFPTDDVSFRKQSDRVADYNGVKSRSNLYFLSAKHRALLNSLDLSNSEVVYNESQAKNFSNMTKISITTRYEFFIVVCRGKRVKL